MRVYEVGVESELFVGRVGKYSKSEWSSVTFPTNSTLSRKAF